MVYAVPLMTTSRTHKIAIITGDGIGKEVIPAGLAAIEAAIKNTGISLEFTELPWGCDYYLRHGRMMDADGFERAATFGAIYLGAIGSPAVPDHIAHLLQNASVKGASGASRQGYSVNTTHIVFTIRSANVLRRRRSLIVSRVARNPGQFS